MFPFQHFSLSPWLWTWPWTTGLHFYNPNFLIFKGELLNFLSLSFLSDINVFESNYNSLYTVVIVTKGILHVSYPSPLLRRSKVKPERWSNLGEVKVCAVVRLYQLWLTLGSILGGIKNIYFRNVILIISASHCEINLLPVHYTWVFFKCKWNDYLKISWCPESLT